MGSKPIHLMSAADRAKVPTIKDFFVDTGRSKKELEKLISVGDTITRERKMIEMGDCLNCKSLDNRVSVFVLIEMLKELQNPPYDVYAVFTVQEEIGIRGANVSSMDINPDFGFGLDTTIAFDTPGSTKQEQVSALGEGACIKVMDSSTVCDYRMVAYMKEISKKKKNKNTVRNITRRRNRHGRNTKNESRRKHCWRGLNSNETYSSSNRNGSQKRCKRLYRPVKTLHRKPKHLRLEF